MTWPTPNSAKHSKDQHVNLETPKCIYCGLGGPFTKEHAFSKGLGGDDKDYLLVNIVCGKCNGDFSKLETALLRRSSVALSRIVNDQVTRGKEKGPVFQTTLNLIHDNTSNSLLEANLEGGFKQKLLPQVLFKGKELNYQADCHADLASFFETLKPMFSAETIETIRKDDNGFNVDTYAFDGESYKRVASQLTTDVPSSVIWLENHTPNGSEPSSIVYHPRLYRRQQGQLAFKALVGEDVSTYLTLSRLGAVQGFMDGTDHAVDREIPSPVIHVGFSSPLSECDRAYAKIGLNMLIHHAGPDFVRHPAFDDIKCSITKGYPELPLTMLDDNYDDLFGDVPAGHHVVALLPHRMSDGLNSITCISSIYGSKMGVILTRAAPAQGLNEIIYYLVDYNNHKIKKMTLLEYSHTSKIIEKLIASHRLQTMQ